MDVSSGKTYPSYQAALDDGVLTSNLVWVEGDRLALKQLVVMARRAAAQRKARREHMARDSRRRNRPRP